MSYEDKKPKRKVPRWIQRQQLARDMMLSARRSGKSIITRKPFVSLYDSD